MSGSRLKKPEAYSLEYVEVFSGAEHKADVRGSFAAAEWHDSDRLLGFVDSLSLRLNGINFQLCFPHRSRHRRDRKPTYESCESLKLALSKDQN